LEIVPYMIFDDDRDGDTTAPFFIIHVSKIIIDSFLAEEFSYLITVLQLNYDVHQLKKPACSAVIRCLQFRHMNH